MNKKNLLIYLLWILCRKKLQQIKKSFKIENSSSRMIKVKIDEIIFKPKFKCSLSIIAKIQNQQFPILDQISFTSSTSQVIRQFPILSTIQLENSSKLSKNNFNFFLNVILKTQNGKVKLASIKKNIHQISSSEQKEQEKLLNSHDKNAKIIYSILFNSFNFNKNQNQYGKLPDQNKKNFVMRRIKALEKQNDYRIYSRKSLYSSKNDRINFNNIWQKLSSQNKQHLWLSPQLAKIRSLQAKRSESNQSRKTSRFSKAYNQQYKQWYLQIKNRMQIIQKKYNKSQQKVQSLQQQIKQFKKIKDNLEKNNKKLKLQIKQRNQQLADQKNQLKKIKNVLSQTQREIKLVLQSQATQIEKLQYRQILLREKLKTTSDSYYELQQEKENLQKEIQKLKEEIHKKNSKLVQNQKKMQQQEKTQNAQLKTVKLKFKEMEVQNNKLKKVRSDLEIKIKEYEHQKEKLKQLQKTNKRMVEKMQKFTQQVEMQKKENSQKIIQLTNQLKKSDQIIQKLQNKILIQEQEKNIAKRVQTFTEKQNHQLKNEIQRICLLYKQSKQQLVNLKGVQDNLKNSLMRSTQKLQKSQKSLTTQIKRQQKEFQKQLESHRAIIQQKQTQMQQLKNEIERQLQQNYILKSQISILKQNLHKSQAKNKGRALKQSTRLDQFQSQKIIKFNLTQLLQLQKVQQQNKQLKKQIKKLQKTIAQLRQALEIQKNKIRSQTEIKIQNEKQSQSSIQTKQKEMKLAEQISQIQKIQSFQIQKVDSKSGQKKQLSPSFKQQSLCNSQLYLSCQKIGKNKDNVLTSEEEAMININKNTFLNESFRSVNQESLTKSEQSFKFNIRKISQDQ